MTGGVVEVDAMRQVRKEMYQGLDPNEKTERAVGEKSNAIWRSFLVALHTLSPTPSKSAARSGTRKHRCHW